MSELTLEFNVVTRAVQFAVPAELIKKNIKNIQKQVEKTKKQCLEEISRVQKNPHASVAQKLVSVKKLIKVVENSTKKLARAVELDREYRHRLAERQKRLRQLQDYTSGELLDLHREQLMEWFMQETNLLVVDYLLKCSESRGQNMGVRLLERLGGSALIDHDIYTMYNSIFLAISHDHNLEPVESWHNDNKAHLRKINSNLLFEIHYCKYLFLIEKGNVWDAIHYSTQNLACYALKSHYALGQDDPNYAKNVATLEQMGSPLILLVFGGVDTAGATWPGLLTKELVAPFMKYHAGRSAESWRLLYQTFAQDFASVYGITKHHPMFIYLSAGLLSLKTKLCYCNEQNTIFSRSAGDSFDHLDLNGLRNLALRGPNQYYRLLGKINQCPVCSPELYTLSRSLPDAQLITHIFDNPFKLPNGNIYPFDKVLNAPEADPGLVRNGKIRDPLTQEIFLIDDCVRVFPA